MRRAFGMAVAAGLCLAAGCATRPADPPDGLKARYCGLVIRARPDERYVVLECGWPPAPGTEVTLVRGGAEVGRARVTSRRRGTYITAEILEGEPAAGDAIGPAGGAEDTR